MTKRVFSPRSWGVLVDVYELVSIAMVTDWDDQQDYPPSWEHVRCYPVYTVAWVRR